MGRCGFDLRGNNMDVRLQEVPFEFNGKSYKLRCNFNVLADIINDFGGKLPEMNITVFPRILAPMLNDYADEQGWAERYKGKDVGRLLPTSMFVTPEGQKQMLQIQQLVINALYVDTGETDEKN